MNTKVYNIWRLLFCSVTILIAVPAFSNQAAYSLGLEVAKQQKQDAMSALKNFDPKALLEFTANPEEIKYYGGVTHKIDTLSGKTKSDAAKSQAATAVAESFSKNPTYKIDKNSPESNRPRNDALVVAA